MTLDLDTTVFVLHVVTLAALYLFLILVAGAAWRDAQGRATPESAARLVLCASGQTGLAVGHSWPVQGQTMLGRSPECAVCLPDPSVSAVHALITARAGHWWIEDQGSLNHTMLNEIIMEKPARLSRGDVVGLGQVRLRFEG